MERTSQATPIIRLGSNVSLLAAVFACLTMWGGISLLLTHNADAEAPPLPSGEPALPQPKAHWEDTAQARRALADLLLFWLPLGLGALACAVGVFSLAFCRERDPDASRRALIALVLSAIPGCLCTLWYLAFSVSPILRK